jgi:hypothetical protein
MCNFNGNLVAWMDGELASDIAVNVEKHVQSCADCRRQVALYESASRDFTAYYVMRDQSQPVAVSANRIPRWAPYAAAVVAILLVALMSLRPDKPAQIVSETAKVTTPAVVESSAEPARPTQSQSTPVAHQRHVRNNSQAAESLAPSAIQIAIPAEAMFPPGAVPEGVAYIASLAPDGSVQSIRLQP